MRILKKDTARDILIFMTDSSDHVTGKASLSLTITASKNAAAFGSISPTVTDRGSGWYKLELTTSHTDTLGDFVLHVTGTGADPTDIPMQVCAELPGELSVASILAIWHQLTSAITTASTIGKLLKDNIDATISSRSTLTAAGVWDALTSGITTANTIGKLLVDNINATISSRSTLTAALVWDALLSGITTASSIGKLIKDNLDAAITTRLASASYTAPDNSTISDIQSDVTDIIDTFSNTVVPALQGIGYRKNTSVSGFQFPMYDAAGALATGLTVDMEISQDGSSLVASTNPVSEISDGMYTINITAAEMDGQNILLVGSATGAQDTVIRLNTENT